MLLFDKLVVTPVEALVYVPTSTRPGLPARTTFVAVRAPQVVVAGIVAVNVTELVLVPTGVATPVEGLIVA